MAGSGENGTNGNPPGDPSGAVAVDKRCNLDRAEQGFLCYQTIGTEEQEPPAAMTCQPVLLAVFPVRGLQFAWERKIPHAGGKRK